MQKAKQKRQRDSDEKIEKQSDKKKEKTKDSDKKIEKTKDSDKYLGNCKNSNDKKKFNRKGKNSNKIQKVYIVTKTNL